MTDLESIATFLGGTQTICLGVPAWDMPDMQGLKLVLFYDTLWDWLMMAIRKINSLGKETQFAIFKTYVSCTVEKSSKFYKDFSFSHAEYITPEQTDIQAAYKLVVKFVKWYDETNLSKSLVESK